MFFPKIKIVLNDIFFCFYHDIEGEKTRHARALMNLPLLKISTSLFKGIWWRLSYKNKKPTKSSLNTFIFMCASVKILIFVSECASVKILRSSRGGVPQMNKEISTSDRKIPVDIQDNFE